MLLADAFVEDLLPGDVRAFREDMRRQRSVFPRRRFVPMFMLTFVLTDGKF